MLVESLMTRDVESARPESTLAEAAAVMWRRDCVGVPSLNDVIGRTRKGKGGKRVSRRAALAALRAVCAPHGSGGDEHAGGDDEEAAGEEHYDEAASAQEAEEARREHG